MIPAVVKYPHSLLGLWVLDRSVSQFLVGELFLESILVITSKISFRNPLIDVSHFPIREGQSVVLSFVFYMRTNFITYQEVKIKIIKRCY